MNTVFRSSIEIALFEYTPGNRTCHLSWTLHDERRRHFTAVQLREMAAELLALAAVMDQHPPEVR